MSKVIFRASPSGTTGKVDQENIWPLFLGLNLGLKTCFCRVGDSYQKSEHNREQMFMAAKLFLLPSFPPPKSF